MVTRSVSEGQSILTRSLAHASGYQNDLESKKLICSAERPYVLVKSMRDLDELPNPFSLNQRDPLVGRLALIRACKVAVFGLVLLVVVTYGSQLARQQQIAGIKNRFSSMSVDEKLAAIQELAASGTTAIPVLAEALTGENEEVAIRSVSVLRAHQNEWALLDSEQAAQNHLELVNAVREVVVRLPAERRSLVQNLLQQSMDASIDRPETRMQQTYILARGALDQLSGPSTLHNNDGSGSSAPVLAHIADADWTDWPPAMIEPSETIIPPVPSVDLVGMVPDVSDIPSPKLPTAEPIPSRGESSSHVDRADYHTATAKIYRSGSPLKKVDHVEPVLLKNIKQPIASVGQPNVQTTGLSLPTTIDTTPHIVDLPFQNHTATELFGLLSSSDEIKLAQAQDEYRRRGIAEQQIRIATKIANGGTAAKSQWLSTVGQANNQNRLWLTILLQDPEREIKLRTISVITQTKDPWLHQQLRMHMIDETDPAVVSRIRRVLNLR